MTAGALPPGHQFLSPEKPTHPALHLYPHIHGHVPLHAVPHLPRPLIHPTLYTAPPFAHSKVSRAEGPERAPRLSLNTPPPPPRPGDLAARVGPRPVSRRRSADVSFPRDPFNSRASEPLHLEKQSRVISEFTRMRGPPGHVGGQGVLRAACARCVRPDTGSVLYAWTFSYVRWVK